MIGFWAKTGATPDEYLPVDSHLHDAGEVALRLFDVSLTARQKAWIASSFGVSVERARSLVAFLVAAHDIGKIGPFQYQVPVLAGELGSTGLPGFLDGPKRHDRVSGYVLHHYVGEHGGSRSLADMLAAAVCGHHCVPAAIRGRERRLQLRVLAPWWPHQQAALDRVAEAFDVCSFEEVDAPSHAVTLALAGLVNVCDWNASDHRRFPVTVDGRSASASLAHEAITTEAWEPRPVAVGPSFADTFGFPPRATQAAVVDLLEGAELPAMILVEDRTGSGKTEAALWAARCALERGARGLYVGLPTRVTAEQFHRRTATFLDALWPERRHELRLLHGGAHLRDQSDPEPSGLGEEGVGELAAARMWFDGARRGLLSPYAVGTVDQALLAVLSARFYPVRLWGIAGKVVVVDEVHSYDAYTLGLLESLLRWVGALECSVVVLSATLPRRRRDGLVAAYRDGLRGPEPSRSDSESEPPGYPRVTLVNRTIEQTTSVVDDRPGRTVGLEQVACADDAERVVQAAASAVAGGGCAAVVCSTVGLAQQRFTELRRQFPDIPALLLHARIRPLERGPIEAELAARLGPQAIGDARPDRLIVVATQIVEQSLDIDFDVMFSDLAPIDLLVQRAGRVHRHDRDARPPSHRDPQLVVLDTAGGQEIDRDLPAGAGAVYVDAVLMRTRAVLRGRSAIREPADLDELIETVYATAPPPCLTAAEHAAVIVQDRCAEEQAARHRRWAERNGIGRPDRDDPPWSIDPGVIEDGEAPGAGPKHAAVTRWSEHPSVDIVVLREDEAHLARVALGPAAARELLLRAVGISDRRITAAVLEDPDAYLPRPWRNHGGLCHQALVVLDEGKVLDIDWRPELGVIT